MSEADFIAEMVTRAKRRDEMGRRHDEDLVIIRLRDFEEWWGAVGTKPRAQLPEGDVRLADGRVLKQTPDDRFVKMGGTIEARHWRGPHGLSVIASLDDTLHGLLLHVSLAYPNADPSWRDIRMVRDAFYPSTVDVMMMLPAEMDYVNVHQHCFHLWQTPVGWGIR